MARRALTSLAIESLVWLLPVSGFLVAYAGHAEGGPQAALPHLAVLAIGFVALAGLRLVLWRWLPAPAARALVASAFATAFWFLVAYYALVLVGLSSWGRVVTWTLIVAYVKQLPGLAESLGLSVGLLALAATLLFVGSVLAVDRCCTRYDAMRWVASKLRPGIAAAVAVCATLVAAFWLYDFQTAPPVVAREPFSLTFFSAHGAAQLQNNRNPAVRALREQARAERLSYKPAPPGRRPNVIVVVVDALRADRLSVTGYSRDTTPFLASLQRAGRLQVVPRAVAACAESYCGLMAILRSRPVHMLTDLDISLQDVLRLNGYKVRFALAGDHTRFYGLRDAYGPADSYFDGSMAPGRYPNDDEALLEHVGQLGSWDGQPVVMQFHLMSAHPLGIRRAASTRFLPARPYVVPGFAVTGDRAERQLEATNHFDNGVVQMDEVLRRLVTALADRNYLSDAWLVLVGDHGEMLGEHGEFGHAQGVFEPALRVPLAFAGFGAAAPLVVAEPAALASQIDIAPTLLAALGLPQPATWQGRPLQQAHAARTLTFRQGHNVGVYERGEDGHTIKYWMHLRSGEERVYDVDADPGETRNLAPTLGAERLARLRGAAMPVVASVPE